MSFHFNNEIYKTSGDSSGNPAGDNPFYGDEMLEFVTARHLSRPTDHFRSPSMTQSVTNVNPYAPPPRQSHSSHNIASWLKDPVGTTLNSFSKVTNMVISPSFHDIEEWTNTLHPVRPPGGAVRASGSSPRSPSPREVDIGISMIEQDQDENRPRSPIQLPPPALPPIPCSIPQIRLTPLTEEEFQEMMVHKESSSRRHILQRVFAGVSQPVNLQKIESLQSIEPLFACKYLLSVE